MWQLWQSTHHRAVSRQSTWTSRKDRPFDLAEIARHEKWGDYTAASTTKDETAQKGDKGLAEATSCWYGDMGNVVIKCNHPGAKEWQKYSKQLVQDVADYHGMEPKEIVRRVQAFSQDQAWQLQRLLESDEGKSSLVAASRQRMAQEGSEPKGSEGSRAKGPEDSGASQPAAEAPALISAHPALTRPVPQTAMTSADAGKQTDWFTSTAASLSRAQQNSAEYDSMAKSIGLAIGAASIAPSQELHLPNNVVPQPKKDEHASGKSGGCRSSWLSMDVIFCLVLLFGDSAVWIESAAQSQCSNWQPWADFSSAEDMCEAVATDVAAVDSADATAVAAQQAILIQSETVEVDAETHGVERVADSAFAQHQGAGDVFSPMVLLGTPELTLPGDAAESAATSLATLHYLHAEDQQAVAAVLAFSCPCFTPIKAEDKHGSSVAPACTIARCAVYAMLQRAMIIYGLMPFMAGHSKPLPGLLGSCQSQASGSHSCIGVVLGASGDSPASTTFALVLRQQDPTIPQGYPATAEYGGYGAACLVSMTDDPAADPDADLMSSNVLLALQGMMRAASRCGHLPSSGLVSAEFGYIAQSSIASDGSCPALQPITPPSGQKVVQHHYKFHVHNGGFKSCLMTAPLEGIASGSDSGSWAAA
ncbi:hypothetical protein WJX82_005216 [Trebouxia sp. C0006]